MKRSKMAVFSAVLLLSTTSGFALAQTVIPTPAVRANIDVNGVDLSSGTFRMSEASVSIGSPAEGGLTHSRTWLGTAWTHGYMMTITTTPTSATVTMGASSTKFTLSSGNYVSDAQDGTTLTSTATTYVFTMSDGTAVTFDRSLAANSASYNGTTAGVATLVAKPNGERIVLTYKRASYTSGSTLWFLRLQSVDSNMGYQLKYRYVSNTLSASTVTDWTRMSRVMAINRSVDYCDPSADACGTLTQTWPEAIYSVTTSGSNKIETVSGPVGLEKTYTTDTSGKLISVQSAEPGSSATGILYDGSGRVSQVQQGIGTGPVWDYSWSVSGNLLTGTMTGPSSAYQMAVADTAKLVVNSTTDSFNKTTNYGYDSYNRLTKITQPEGNYVQYYYDGRGNIIQVSEMAKPGTTISGGSSGRGVQANYSTSCTNIIICNKPLSTTDARGYTTDYTYDSVTGQLLTSTLPEDSSHIRPQTRYTYTALQAYYKNSSGSIVASGQSIKMLSQTSQCRSTASCSGTADEEKAVLDRGLQTAGNANNLLPISITQSGNGLSATTSMTYDIMGNMLTVDGPLTGSNDTTRYRYDSKRQLFGIVHADPDGAGGRPRLAERMISNIDGQITSMEFGTVADLTESGWNAFSSQFKRKLTYNANGLLATDAIVAPTGTQQYKITQYEYDVINRLYCTAVRMNAPATTTSLPGCTTAMTAGANGADRISTNFYYFGSNRINSTSVANVGVIASYTYSDNGMVVTASDGKGNKTTFEYDGIDRLVKARYPTAANGSTSSTTDYDLVTLDGNDNITQKQLRDASTVSVTYDGLNRMSSMWGASVPTRNFTYDLQNRPKSATQPGDSFTHSFGYDGLGRLTSETEPYGSASYQYDIAGRRTRLTWSDGLYVTYDYDSAGNVTAIRENGAASGAGVLATYTYDNMGNRSGVTRGNGTSTTYTSDSIMRLSSLAHNLAGTSSDITRGITYTPSSQILTVTSNNSTFSYPGFTNLNRSYTINGLNQYTISGSTNITYDGRGNLASSGANSYSYNGFNQMVSAPGGVTLKYDALGRLAQTSGSSVTRFSYGGSDLIAEYNNVGTMLRRYVPGPSIDEPILWYEGSTTTDRRWLHADERGSIIVVSDSSGNAIAKNSYDEYGIPASTNTGRYQYTGQTWLPEIGMYYFKARIYSPTLGRFMQTDPIGYEDGLNMYAYAANDPLNLTDPTGTEGAVMLPIMSMIIVTGKRPIDSFIDAINLRDAFQLPDSRLDSANDIVVTGKPSETPAKKPQVRLPNETATAQNDKGDDIVVTALKKVGQCAADHYGLGALGAGLTAAGQPIPGTKPFVTPGSSKGTSLAGMAADAMFGKARSPVRLPTVVGSFPKFLTGRSLGIAGTKSVARFAGRAVPILGEALLAYDAISILACTATSD